MAWRQKESECLEHCAAYDLTRSFQWITRKDKYILSNEEAEKWTEDYEDRETAVVRNQVQDTVTAILQEQEHMANVENARSTTTKHETSFEDLPNAVGDSQSDQSSSHDEENWEDKDDYAEDTDHGKVNKDDRPGWVMRTITEMVQYRIESFRHKPFSLQNLTYPECGNPADSVCEREMKYGTTQLMVPVVVKLQTDITAATPSPISFENLMQTRDMVPGRFEMPPLTLRPRRSQLRLCSERPDADSNIVSLASNPVLDSSQIVIAKPGQPVSVYACICHPKPITI